MLLTGSESLITLRVVGIALAALNCGLMVAVAWLATGRRAVGYLAGGILAIYPIAAFYDTDLVITSQAVILATAQLLGAVWLWRRPGQWWGALLLGLAAGASAVTRIEVAILAPVFSLWLLAARRDRWAFLQISLATIVALLIVTPFMQHNRRGGRDFHRYHTRPGDPHLSRQQSRHGGHRCPLQCVPHNIRRLPSLPAQGHPPGPTPLRRFAIVQNCSLP